MTETLYVRSHMGKTGQTLKGLWALVPVKVLSAAKQRLADTLGAEREELALAMLRDVLAALVGSAEVCQVALVTADPEIATEMKFDQQLAVMENQRDGLNTAVEWGVKAICRLGGRRVIIFPADVPLITAAEVDRLVQYLDEKVKLIDQFAIGIGPSKERNGTNCLILNTDQAFTFCYGPDSFDLHRQSAHLHHCEVIPLHSETVSRDVDESADLDSIVSYCIPNPEFQQTETWKFLHKTGRTLSALTEN